MSQKVPRGAQEAIQVILEIGEVQREQPGTLESAFVTGTAVRSTKSRGTVKEELEELE